MHFWRDIIDRNWNLFQNLIIWLEFLHCVSICYWISNNIISSCDSAMYSKQMEYSHRLFCCLHFLFNLNLFVFNWRIIALQCCVGLCHTTAWISHRYMQVHFLLSLPPTSSPIPPLCQRAQDLSSLLYDAGSSNPVLTQPFKNTYSVGYLVVYCYRSPFSLEFLFILSWRCLTWKTENSDECWWWD